MTDSRTLFFHTTEMLYTTGDTVEETTTDRGGNSSISYIQVFTGFDTAFLFYIGCLMVVGILGNLAVFTVFFLRFPQTSYRTFVLCLAALDLLMCCFGMPKTIMLIRYKEVFANIATCKCIVFIVKYLAASSLIILPVIALDRYWKVCHPTKAKAKPFHPKIAVGITLTFVFVMITPALVLYGDQKTLNGTLVSSCTVPDRYTKFNKAFEGSLLILLLIIFAILVMSYSLIARQILKRRKSLERKTSISARTTHSIKLDNSSTSGLQTTDEMSLSETNIGRQVSFKPRSTANGEQVEFLNGNKKVNKPKASKNKRQGKTYILFVVTVITVVSWIPHFTLELIQTSNQEFYSTLSPGVLFVCRFFFFSYYWNTIANPFLYGICDRKFQTQLKSLAADVFHKCCPNKKMFTIQN